MSEKRRYIPKLGKRVYCIYGDGIFVDYVGYLGKDSFIVESFNNATNEDSWEWNYDEYNAQWFTSISKAKKALIEKHKDECKGRIKIVQVSYDWYELAYY